MGSTVTPTITHVGQFGHMINAYLVHEDDGLTLVDGLQGNQSVRILAAAESIGAPIVRITLTHAHSDHVGAIDALVDALPDAEFIVGRREAKLLSAKPTLEPGEPSSGRLLPISAGVRSTPARTLEPGDMVGSLRVVSSPGHSLGDLSFVDTRDDAVICGDVYSTIGGVATTAGPFWRFPLPGTFSWHRPTVVQSAARLAALEPSILLPGHGRPVAKPASAMRAAVARRGGDAAPATS
jgi:glyoxylase-like metal-dependent hydrolase (beta-lactamase superfamily II)